VLFEHGELSYYKTKQAPNDAIALPSAAGTIDLSQANTLIVTGSSSKA